jgi:hypothetical protein
MSKVQFIIFAALILGYSSFALVLLTRGCLKLIGSGTLLSAGKREAAVRPPNRRAWTRAVWRNKFSHEIQQMAAKKGSINSSGPVALY